MEDIRNLHPSARVGTLVSGEIEVDASCEVRPGDIISVNSYGACPARWCAMD